MENTLENKAKFFAQYWGQQVCVQGLNVIEPKYILRNPNLDNLSSWFLELKPLSSITDEDAIEVAKILGLFEPLYIKRYNDYLFLKQDENHNVDIWLSINEIDTSVNGVNIEYHFAYQYLRSKGYALPYMGLSVEKQVEYGWIKLKVN